MSTLVECDTALDRHGNPVHIRDAASGAKGYSCPSCGAEMVAHLKRRRNEAHFQHRPNYQGEVFDCLWSNESYRHKIAKKLLRLHRQLKVPALLPIRPEGYEGPLPRILEPQVFTALRALEEHCVYEDEQGQPRFAEYLYYEKAPTGKVLLVRPDVVFCSANLVPLLFVEICVTHSPGDEKLARLRRLGVPTLEITVPACKSEQELAHFLTHSTAGSRWLYHPQQYVFQPDPDHSFHTGRRGRAAAANKRRLLGFESVKCRAIRVADALRGVNKFLAGAEHAARRAAAATRLAELGAEEVRLEGSARAEQRKMVEDEVQAALLVAAAAADFAPISRAATQEFERVMAERRQAHRAAAAGISAAAAELAQQEEAIRTNLVERLQRAFAGFEREEAALQGQESRLRSRYAERDDLSREEAALDREEAELAEKEAGVRTSLARLQQSLEAEQRRASEVQNRFATAFELERKITENERLTARKAACATSGRLALGGRVGSD